MENNSETDRSYKCTDGSTIRVKNIKGGAEYHPVGSLKRVQPLPNSGKIHLRDESELRVHIDETAVKILVGGEAEALRKALKHTDIDVIDCPIASKSQPS